MKDTNLIVNARLDPELLKRIENAMELLYMDNRSEFLKMALRRFVEVVERENKKGFSFNAPLPLIDPKEIELLEEQSPARRYECEDAKDWGLNEKQG